MKSSVESSKNDHCTLVQMYLCHVCVGLDLNMNVQWKKTGCVVEELPAVGCVPVCRSSVPQYPPGSVSVYPTYYSDADVRTLEQRVS